MAGLAGLAEGAGDVGKGAIESIQHPVNAVKSIWSGMQSEADQAAGSFNKLNLMEGLAHVIGITPVIGPAFEKVLNGIGDQSVDDHEFGRRVGQALTLEVAPDAIGKAGDLAAAAGRLAPRLPGAIAAGARAGTPDVLAGAGKVAAGEALAKLPGMEFPARIGMGYPGARQIAKGMEKGGAAFKAALQQKVQAAAEAVTAEAETPAAPPAEPLPDSRQLPAAPLVTPPPEGTPGTGPSYVRSVPLDEINPQMQQRAAVPVAPPSRQIAAPSPAFAMPPAADTSSVRSVPLEEINPQMARQVGEKPAAPPAADPEVLDGLAKALANKPYARLKPEEKVAVDRIAAAGTTKATPPAMPTAPAAETPATPNVSRETSAKLTPDQIAAQLRDELVKNGMPANLAVGGPEAAAAPNVADVSEAMRGMPAGAPKAVADANYAGNQEPGTASAVYEAAGRAEKATKFAQALHDHGVSYAELAAHKADDLSALLAPVAKGLKINAPSKATIGEILFRMQRLEGGLPAESVFVPKAFSEKWLGSERGSFSLKSSWVDPKGNVEPLQPGETHGNAWVRMRGNTGKTVDPFQAGYVRQAGDSVQTGDLKNPQLGVALAQAAGAAKAGAPIIVSHPGGDIEVPPSMIPEFLRAAQAGAFSGRARSAAQ